MAERDRIARHFAPLTTAEPGSFSLTDDAALLAVPVGQQLVWTTDSVIAGVHIIATATPAQFAQKLVRRNLSDLAAMGAQPWRYSLNLHTPAGLSDDWFAAFATMLAAEQTRFGLVLVGGDSTSGYGPIHATLTCLGLMDSSPLRRNGAQIGDGIYVTGTLGDAGLALHLLQQNQPIDTMLAARYFAPEPRLAIGHSLRAIATAAIDVSDGLLADLHQLCTASNVGAMLQQSSLPTSPAMQQFLITQPDFGVHIASLGDDYELCFTAPINQDAALQALSHETGVPITRIGTITAGSGVQLIGPYGPITPPRSGYEHP